MRNLIALAVAAALFHAAPLMAQAATDLLDEYAALGASTPDADSGKRFWQQRHPAGDGAYRACVTCHTDDPRQPGSHPTTGKTIDPLAPAINPKRLRDRREIEKWFKRNCKWTLGRECSAQEKGDVLSYLLSL